MDTPWLIEPTEQTFQADVVERSSTTLVVLDFWAPWCGPCRQLAPILERLAAEYAGQFVLAKVNTDAQPRLAAAFGVQSIPMVVAIRAGQVVDGFQGALPEPAIREWLQRLLPSKAEQLVHAAEELESTDPAAAEVKFRAALEQEPALAAAQIGLARLLLGQSRLDEVGAILTALEARGYLEPEAEKIKSQWHVRQAAAAAGGSARLRQAIEQEPDNLALQVQLAEALAAEGTPREALELCLQVIARDRVGAGVAAKQAMLDILNTLNDPELASEYRRRLASLLY